MPAGIVATRWLPASATPSTWSDVSLWTNCDPWKASRPFPQIAYLKASRAAHRSVSELTPEESLPIASSWVLACLMRSLGDIAGEDEEERQTGGLRVGYLTTFECRQGRVDQGSSPELIAGYVIPLQPHILSCYVACMLFQGPSLSEQTEQPRKTETPRCRHDPFDASSIRLISTLPATFFPLNDR